MSNFIFLVIGIGLLALCLVVIGLSMRLWDLYADIDLLEYRVYRLESKKVE